MIHVFAGPTLPAADPALSGPQFRARLPVRHGDLFDPAIAGGDSIVIIDGLYHHSPALRHKEIIAAMARGVRVIGAASIGARRAAEPAPCGMLGVGEVFRSYASGFLQGDDEVVVGQADDGDPRSVTWPLVNLRHTLRLVAEDGIVTAEQAIDILEALRAVYYPHRSLTAVMTVKEEGGGGAVKLDGAARARTPEETWQALLAELERLGISRIARLTDLDHVGIPVWAAIRPAGRTLVTTQGKGASDELAKVSAVLEGAELWHAEQPAVVAEHGPHHGLALPYPLGPCRSGSSTTACGTSRSTG